MNNWLNSSASKLYKNWTALFLAGALMQWCASTNNKVNDVMSVNHDDITPPTSLENKNNNNSNTDVDFNANPDSRSWNLVFSKDNSRLNIWLEDSENLWLITSVEYANVWDKWWTLVTTNFWEDKQSYLLTGLYKWVDFSAKATAWYLKQDFEGSDIGQKYLWAEFLKDFSDVVKNLRAWMYVNATQADSKTLSVETVTRDVTGWQETITTTTRFEGEDTNSMWVVAEYNYGKNSFDASFGNTDIDWSATNYSLGYTYSWEKIRPSVEYSRLDGDSFDSEIYRGQVDYIISDWFSVWLGYEKVNSTSFDDNRVMLTFSYTPGLKSYSNTREYNHMNLDHVTWANDAMSTLYGQKQTTTVSENKESNNAPNVSNILVTGDLPGYIPLDISLDISDDDLSQVTWELEMKWTAIENWLSTGSFSQSSWTWDTLKNITYTPSRYGIKDTSSNDARVLTVTITDNWSWDVQNIVLYRD